MSDTSRFCCRVILFMGIDKYVTLLHLFVCGMRASEWNKTSLLSCATRPDQGLMEATEVTSRTNSKRCRYWYPCTGVQG